ncbi:alpha/beta hydrolase family protein [Porphyromonas crevioricanis]|uniref:Uncharacterized protein n=3 Tax=Porphyromonas crevioricanis TaxID=393921 RepID=A0AB34PHD7_9PORP|nr:alpha/beta fold hydrolase [Porphyromonas crevioricanis]KGN94044.1 hypothetical protein HQ38_07565 [Porphyromonas crevioricanis]
MKSKSLLVLLALLVALPVSAQNFIGSWSGQISFRGTSLRIVFNISKNTEGKTVCTVDSPNQSVKGIPASIEFASSDSISIRIPNIGIEYNGKIQGDMIYGTYSQAGVKLELNLKNEELVYLRPQNPQPPYPYTTEEIEFVNEDENATLSGTITYPVNYQKGKKIPVIVMVTGSGPQNRDNEIYEHKPFLVIADYLAGNGYATLRYDDRCVGKSTGKYQAETTKEVAKDAALAVKYLRETKQFSKIGLLGHSEGGSVVFMLAAEKQIDFAICMAGVGIQGDECLYQQGVAIAKQFGQEYQFTKKQLRDYLKGTMSPWYEFFLDYNPASDISKTTCPIFVMNGEKDLQVIASSNVEVIRNNLPKNKKSKVKIYPGLNHLFQECTTGVPTEYINIKQTISPIVLEDIVDWLKQIF